MNLDCFAHLFSIRIHGIAASDNANYFHGHANGIYSDLGLESLKSESLCSIVEGYKGKGYGASTQEELGRQIHQTVQFLLLTAMFILYIYIMEYCIWKEVYELVF